MALYLKKELEETRSVIGVWQITETEEELRELASVPNDEMEEISFISNESLRKQRLAVRALLCELFGEKVYLSHHDNGKPYLENMVTNISISHTRKYVAVTTWTTRRRMSSLPSTGAQRKPYSRESLHTMWILPSRSRWTASA